MRDLYVILNVFPGHAGAYDADRRRLAIVVLQVTGLLPRVSSPCARPASRHPLHGNGMIPSRRFPRPRPGPRLFMSSMTARVGAGSGEVPGRTLFSRLPVCSKGVALSWRASWPGAVARRGSRRVCVQLEIALPVLAGK